ncbi:MAG: helix-turn-helix domain-containing protein [Oscillospiraceae bacterium]
MAYYSRIRDLREDSDKTQSELAEYLGTTTQYYGLYEKGANEISFERAILLAKYYNVSLDYIAGLTNSKRGLSKGDLTPEQQELIEFITSLKENERDSLAKISELIQKTINK